MSSPRFDGFIFDELNEEKFAEHGVTARQVAFVLYESEFALRRNRNQRSGLYLAIGWDQSGLCIAIPLRRTAEPNVWRPVTAWLCKEWEERLLR